MKTGVGIQGPGVRDHDVIVLVDVLVHVPVTVIDYPAPIGHGTAIGAAPKIAVLFNRGGESRDS